MSASSIRLSYSEPFPSLSHKDDMPREQKQYTFIIFIIEMASKRSKIVLLKEKVTQMQNQLHLLQASEQTKRQSLSPRKRPTPSPQRNCHKNRDFKSPTFWGTNPINFDERYSPKRYERSISPTNRSQEKQLIERTSSPILKNVANTIDKHYYNSVKQHQEKQTHDISYFYETAYTGKRFENSAFGMSRGSVEKQDKKKTFQIKRTDTINNPEKEKLSYRKIVKFIEKSPEKMFTQNPKSNPNMYFYANKALILERKGSLRDKNQSNIELAHCASEMITTRRNENTIQSKRKKSQKKHFSQYFRDTLLSQF